MVVRVAYARRHHDLRPRDLGIGDPAEQVAWGPLAAAALLVTAPVLVLTLFIQKEIVGGLTAGGVKGG